MGGLAQNRAAGLPRPLTDAGAVRLSPDREQLCLQRPAARHGAPLIHRSAPTLGELTMTAREKGMLTKDSVSLLPCFYFVEVSFRSTRRAQRGWSCRQPLRGARAQLPKAGAVIYAVSLSPFWCVD